MSLFDATLSGFVPSAWWLADLVLRTLLLLAVVRVALALLHRRSAAQRHLIGLCGLLAVAALPVAMLVLPSGLGLLPSLARAAAAPAAPDSLATGAATAWIVWPPAAASVPLWLTLLLIVWAAGGAALGLRALSASHGLEGFFRRGENLERATTALEAARQRVGLPIRPEIRTSDEIDIPVTFGLLEPKILLPSEASTWTTDRLEWVLLHELAHVVRRDPAAQAAGIAVCCLFWWQPVVWHLAQRLELEREHAADDLVLAHRSDAIAYARQLFDIAENLRGRPMNAFGLSMARPGQLGPRLHAMLDAEIDRSRTGPMQAMTAFLGLAIVLTPLAAMPGPVATPEVLHGSPAPAVDGVDLSTNTPRIPSMRAPRGGQGWGTAGHRSGHHSSGHHSSGHQRSGHQRSGHQRSG